MNRILATGFVTLTLSSLALAQADDERFNKQQADRMHGFAKQAFKKGFPRQARLIWLQLLKLYNKDHEAAHKALGHVRVGKAWNPNPKFSYPINDTGSGSDGKSLYSKYESLKKSLASAHRGQAQRWHKAGRKDKSDYHYKMVLRWVKNDRQAQAALQHKSVGEVTGTDLEQKLYDRSKMIEKTVVEQTKINYEVKEASEAKNALLDNAQVTYKTVKSEHFTLHGDYDTKLMCEALVWAERAMRVVAVAFPKDSGFNENPQNWLREFALFTGKDTYKQILKANASLVSDLDWALEHSSTMSLLSEGGAVRVGSTNNKQTMFDAVVRHVARSYSGFRSDGLGEGVGHTFVGMIFNNNRLFSVDLKKQQGTVASEEDREYQSPNFDVWKDLALEQAWKLTGNIRASTLPLIKAASFSNAQRIKAWSFCDYVMRRDPKLLLAMDRLSSKRNPWDIEAEFKKNHDVTIPQLDKEWEDFWTGASPVMKAIKNNTPPLAAVSKDVAEWLNAFNQVRKELNTAPVTWSSNYSTRCHDHAKYLKENKDQRSIAEIQSQDPQLMKGTHLGNMFAQMALVSTKASTGKAKKIFKKWLDVPGYRDAFVHDFLLSIGIYSEGSTLVMNVVSGLGTPKSKRAGYTCYPRGHQGIPRQVKVKDLGPELKALLEQNGKGKLKVVGYPLTMHFGHQVQGDPTSYSCSIRTAKGDSIPTLILDNSGTNRHTTAPGMITAYPLQPLPSGQIQVQWSWTHSGSPKNLGAKFTCK